MSMTADDIKSRFLTEQSYIQRYVEFLNDITGVHYSKLQQIADSLALLGIRIPLSLPLSRSSRSTSCSASELGDFINAYRSVTVEIEQKISSLENDMLICPEPEGLQNVDVRSVMGEWIDFCLDNLSSSPSETEIKAVEVIIGEKNREVASEYGSDIDNYYLLSNEQIQYCIRSTIFLKLSRQLNSLLSVKDDYSKIEFYHRIISSDAEINTFRQGFILLSTAFDAAMFDLFRIALNNNFFGLISSFGNKGKVSLDLLSSYGSFSRLQESVIEEQLKSRYLKDLLFILEHINVECVDKSKGHAFRDLVEMVVRRNIHVHNRGLVDERYLEFNPYNLALGDIAQIDEAYWEKSNSLCSHCVAKVAIWANSP
jgi:hypothetical protein